MMALTPRSRRRRAADRAIEVATEEMSEALADIEASSPCLRQAVDDLIAAVHQHGGGDHVRHAHP